VLSFVNLLSNISYPKASQKKELWNISGALKIRSDCIWKFDLRPLKNNKKLGSFKTKADKIVFDIKDQYVVVDTEELHQYLKENRVKKVHLEDLISELDWNIILPKN